MKTIFTILFIALVFIGCASNEAALPMADFTIAKNEIFKVNLVANPSTGYTWKWCNRNDIDIADSLSTYYTPLNSDPQILGGSGTETWNFKAIKSGTQIIKLEYCRSWENNSTVATKTFVVHVK